jgi:hypothetical protein
MMQRSLWTFRAVGPAALLAAGLLGCGSDGGNGGKVDESPNLGASTEKMIMAADGGEVALGEAGVKLSIPAGALAADTMISAEVISKSGLMDAEHLAGNVVEFGPDGLQFEAPVMLELEVDDAKIPADAEVSLAWFDEKTKAWKDLPGSKLEDGKVSAETTHFTVFAVRFVVAANGDVVQDAGECSDTFTACGGNIEGTWNIVSGCANVTKPLGNAGGQCQGASLSLGIDITGDIVIGGGTISGTLNMTSEVTQILPKSCVGGSCPMADPEDEGDFVFVDKGDTCEGTQSDSDSNEINGSYRVEGGTFVTTDPETGAEESDDMTEYCVTGNKLVVNSVTDDGVTIRWTAMRK